MFYNSRTLLKPSVTQTMNEFAMNILRKNAHNIEQMMHIYQEQLNHLSHEEKHQYCFDNLKEYLIKRNQDLEEQYLDNLLFKFILQTFRSRHLVFIAYLRTWWIWYQFKEVQRFINTFYYYTSSCEELLLVLNVFRSGNLPNVLNIQGAKSFYLLQMFYAQTFHTEPSKCYQIVEEMYPTVNVNMLQILELYHEEQDRLYLGKYLQHPNVYEQCVHHVQQHERRLDFSMTPLKKNCDVVIRCLKHPDARMIQILQEEYNEHRMICILNAADLLQLKMIIYDFLSMSTSYDTGTRHYVKEMFLLSTRYQLPMDDFFVFIFELVGRFDIKQYYYKQRHRMSKEMEHMLPSDLMHMIVDYL